LTIYQNYKSFCTKPETLLDSPIIEFDSIDSTNNYAMQLIDANTAYPGLTIVAQSQTSGKGQRGRAWVDMPGQSLLMSIITTPGIAISAQFAFNALVATTIADVLKPLSASWDLRIKWPNDIIINDKKAGGILIENVIRGSRWTHCVVGLGLNIKQEVFPPELPFATSLKIGSGQDFNIIDLRDALRQGIMECSSRSLSAETIMKRYNEHLYKTGQKQAFSNNEGKWEATIIGAGADGSLHVQLADDSLVTYYHGQVVWEWEISEF
jgi:BirA family biotin operon repressor/biotin-[acetyl-CoA-carboxylase] ligase